MESKGNVKKEHSLKKTGCSCRCGPCILWGNKIKKTHIAVNTHIEKEEDLCKPVYTARRYSYALTTHGNI